MDYSFYYNMMNPERRERARRGLETGALRVREFRSESRLLAATVDSASGNTYRVRIGFDGMACDCPDFDTRCAVHKRPCKHLLAAMLVDKAGFTLRHGDVTVQVHPVHATYAEDQWGTGYARERDYWRDTTTHKLWAVAA